MGDSGKRTVCGKGPDRDYAPRGLDSTLLEPRERIYEALLDICLERRFEKIELDELVRVAGVDEREFHRHFDDLEDCFCKRLEVEREAFFATIDRALEGEVLWVDRLRAAAYALLRFLTADERRCHFLTTELNAAGERASRIWSETIVPPLFDLIDEGRIERASDGHQTRATAAAVGGAVFYKLTVAAERNALDEAGVPALMYSAVLPYLGQEAASRELSISAPPLPVG